MDIKRELEVMKEIDAANKRHVEEWKARMEADKQMQNFYFTFGSDPEYPYGVNDYVLIRCEGMNEACVLFNARFEKRPGSDCMNCAFVYSEAQWQKRVKEHYAGREPAESIVISKAGNW